MSVGQDERPRGGGVRASGGGFCTRAGDGGPGGVVQGQRPCVLCVRILGFAGQCPRGGRGALFASGWGQITVGGHVVKKGKPFFIAPRDPRTVASSRNRHGWKSNHIVRKVDGNQTTLDGIPTKHRKQQSFYSIFLDVDT